MGSTLLVIVAILLSPFLTYYVTSVLFFRRANSKASSKQPPTVPYFLPGVFNAGGSIFNARKYLKEIIKDYGSFAPFRVRAGFQSYVILRDPVHISRVLDAPEHLTLRNRRIEALDKLFGSANGGKHLREDTASFQEGASLAAATEAYISTLSANMHDKMFQQDTWTRIEDLWSFLQLVLIRCTLETFFGSAMLKRYPKLVRDYLDFDSAIEGFVQGMPRLMLHGASKPRNKLLVGLKEWSATSCIKNDDTTDRAERPEWSATEGLQSIRDHCYALKSDDVEELSLEARATEMLSIIHTTNSALMSSTFWMTVETLRKPHLSRNITAIVGQHFSSITHKYDISGLAQEPLVGSFQAEIQRLRTAACTTRTNVTDGFPLDRNWALRKGDTVAMFSQDVSLNADVWKTSQPQSHGKPLEDFWAERFLVTERRNKSGAPKEQFVPGDLGEIVAGLTRCDHYPGAPLVSALRVATIAILFAEFEVQLCDAEQVDAALPPVNELAYGTVKPVEKIAVRIRKRRT